MFSYRKFLLVASLLALLVEGDLLPQHLHYGNLKTTTTDSLTELITCQ